MDDRNQQSFLIMRKPFFLVIKSLPYSGMAIFPFVLMREKSLRENPSFVYHERIHLVQQLETGILLFYIIYLLHYLFNIVKYREHNKAYREIVFEREAYSCENKIHYLRYRPFWAFLKHF